MVFDRSAINVGRTMQDFGLGDLEGVYRNTAKLRAKGWLIILFFNPKDAHSATVTDMLQKWTTELSADKTALLGVGEGERADVESFAAAHSLSFPIVMDYEQYVAQTWSVSTVPSVFVTNAAGKVASRIVGANISDLNAAKALVAGEIAKAEEAARVAAEKAAADKAAADAAQPVAAAR